MKRIFGVIMAILFLGAATGCAPKKDKILDIDMFFNQALEQVPYDDEMIELSASVVGDFYRLTFEGLEEYRIYTSGTMATANELAVFKLKDEKALTSAEEAVRARLEDQKSNYQNYNPAQMHRIENALLYSDSNYLLFSISNDKNDEIRKLFDDHLS